MQENYLAKWLNNELSKAELAEFKKSDAYASYQRILNATDKLETPEFNEDEILMAVNNRRTLEKTKVVQLNPFKKFMKVLPDNSEVTLNADSQLSYSIKNWTEERNISLNGEAFFKVAKGKRFTVATEAGTVAVLGTQFNVENRDGFFEVTCFEGLVSVTYEGKEIKLPAGTSFVAVNGQIVESQDARGTEPSWLNDESTFKSIPLKYVLREFERQHNIEVETEHVDTDQLYSGHAFANKV